MKAGLLVLNFVPQVYCSYFHQILMIQWNMGLSKTGFVSFEIGSSSKCNKLTQPRSRLRSTSKFTQILHREATFPLEKQNHLSKMFQTSWQKKSHKHFQFSKSNWTPIKSLTSKKCRVLSHWRPKVPETNIQRGMTWPAFLEELGLNFHFFAQDSCFVSFWMRTNKDTLRCQKVVL